MSAKSQAPDPEKLAEEVAKLRKERPTVLNDPERMREIDAQIRELDGQRQALEEEERLAKAEKAANKASTKDD
jgi:hypothetical protein